MELTKLPASVPVQFVGGTVRTNLWAPGNCAAVEEKRSEEVATFQAWPVCGPWGYAKVSKLVGVRAAERTENREQRTVTATGNATSFTYGRRARRQGPFSDMTDHGLRYPLPLALQASKIHAVPLRLPK
jgi:hypothetical protein